MLSYKRLDSLVKPPIVRGNKVYIFANEDIIRPRGQLSGCIAVKTGLEITLTNEYFCETTSTMTTFRGRNEFKVNLDQKCSMMLNDSPLLRRGELIICCYWKISEEDNLYNIVYTFIPKGDIIAMLTVLPVATIKEIM